MPKAMTIIRLWCWGHLTNPSEDRRSQGEEGGFGECSPFHSLPSLQEEQQLGYTLFFFFFLGLGWLFSELEFIFSVTNSGLECLTNLSFRRQR